MRALSILGTGSLLFLLACGGNSGGGDLDGGESGSGDGGADNIDANTGGGEDGGGEGDGDGGVIGPANCEPGDTECTDCIDNDGNGRIDGFDPTCISEADDEEGSFATGISGDNKDPNKQDCFFDGNSGAAPNGMDDCIYQTCCYFDPECDDSCEVLQGCIDFCDGFANPGCDCFGCCTMCDGDGCVDVVTNPAVAPDCTYDEIHNEEVCPTCTKNPDCGSECEPEGCILCPGQDPSDQPDTCNPEDSCPDGQTTCEGEGDCDVDTEYCSNGCCVPQVQID